MTKRPHALRRQSPFSAAITEQYVGFIAVMFGFLLQWPTLLTLAMFPVLVYMYVHLAHMEERETRAEFGEAYNRYAAATPGWIPRLRGTKAATQSRI